MLQKDPDYIEKQGGISQRMCDLQDMFKRYELHHKRHRSVWSFRWRWDDASCGKIDRRSWYSDGWVNLGTLEISHNWSHPLWLDELLMILSRPIWEMMLDGRVIHADHETDHLPALNDTSWSQEAVFKNHLVSYYGHVLLDVYEADGIVSRRRQDLQDIIYQQVAGSESKSKCYFDHSDHHIRCSQTVLFLSQDEIDIYIENVRISVRGSLRYLWRSGCRKLSQEMFFR